MAIAIKNLTKEGIEIDLKEAEKFTSQDKCVSEIKADVEDLTTWNTFDEGDNIEVTWTIGKTKYRAVNGTFSKEEKEGKTTVTIKGLQDVSKYSIGISGQIAIGDSRKENAAALVSVNIGNIRNKDNPKGDTIINLSDKTYSDEGTKINLTALLDWIQQEDTGSERPALPSDKADSSSPIKPDAFMIEFKALYYNVTQKTFDIDVQSSGNSIPFAGFKIMNAGLRITNTPIELPKEEPKKLLEQKALIEPPKEETKNPNKGE